MEKLLTQMKEMLQEQQQQQRTIIAAALSTSAAQSDSRAPRNEHGSNNERERLPNERDALRIRKMQEETAKLAVAAKANNLDTLKAAFGEAAKTCKACHDDFRNQ